MIKIKRKPLKFGLSLRLKSKRIGEKMKNQKNWFDSHLIILGTDKKQSKIIKDKIIEKVAKNLKINNKSEK